MDNSTVQAPDVPEPSRVKKIVLKLRQLVRPSGNVHEKRLRRKMKLVDLITRRLTFIKCVYSV